MGILGVIQIVFLILKLTGVITWPWVAVLIPIWIELFLKFVKMLIYDL